MEAPYGYIYGFLRDSLESLGNTSFDTSSVGAEVDRSSLDGRTAQVAFEGIPRNDSKESIETVSTTSQKSEGSDRVLPAVIPLGDEEKNGLLKKLQLAGLDSESAKFILEDVISTYPNMANFKISIDCGAVHIDAIDFQDNGLNALHYDIIEGEYERLAVNRSAVLREIFHQKLINKGIEASKIEEILGAVLQTPEVDDIRINFEFLQIIIEVLDENKCVLDCLTYDEPIDYIPPPIVNKQSLEFSRKLTAAGIEEVHVQAILLEIQNVPKALDIEVWLNSSSETVSIKVTDENKEVVYLYYRFNHNKCFDQFVITEGGLVGKQSVKPVGQGLKVMASEKIL